MKTVSLLALALLVPAVAAHAADTPSRWAVTAGMASVNQHGDNLVPVAMDPSWPRGTEVEASDDGSAATLGLSWYINQNLAIELWGAGSARSQVEVDIENGPDINVASYRTQPLAVSLQYHFHDVLPGIGQHVTPFVGLGWHQTQVSSIKADADGYRGLDIEDGNGLAASAGVDVALGQRWFVRGDVRYLRWDSQSRVGNTVLAKGDMDTLSYGASIGLRF